MLLLNLITFKTLSIAMCTVILCNIKNKINKNYHLNYDVLSVVGHPQISEMLKCEIKCILELGNYG